MTTPADYLRFGQNHLSRNQNLSLAQLTQLAQFQVPVDQGRVLQSPEGRIDVTKQPYRSFSADEKLRVIGYRYGSMVYFREPVRTVAQVAKLLYMPYSTVERILKKFEAANCKIKSVTAKRARSFKCIPVHVRRVLLSQHLLQVWSPYSLVERVQLIQSTMGLRISSHTLWRFYLDHHVGFYTGLSVYRSFVTQNARIKAERLAFARLIANLIATKDKHLVYMDETTYSTVQSKSRSWAFRSTPVLHPKNNRQMRVTVFGACGPALVGGLVVKLAPSTNSVDYCSFLL